MVKHLLAGVDGSEGSRKAAGFALELADQTSSRVTLLFVLELPRIIPLGALDSFIEIRGTDEEHLQAGYRMLEDIGQRFPADRIQRVVELGRAADTLCSQAEKLGADMIVLGAHGHGRVGHLRLGSVSDRVVHQATRPVAVVR